MRAAAWSVVAFCFNWATAADYLYREDKTVYINYNVWRTETGDAAENGTFDDVHRLIFMDDDLVTLPHSLLASLPTLKDVQAEHCRLRSVIFDDKTSMLGIQSLLASNNHISELVDNAFAGVPALQTLKLQGNDIRNISQLTFANLSRLSVLDLHHNLIRNLHSATFADLTELNYLDLSSNRIGVISANLFENCGKLEFLFLHKNVIFAVAESAFVGANAIIELNLSKNRILHLEPQTFSKLKALTALSLDENHLHAFDLNALNENVMLKMLTLANNSLEQLVASSVVWNHPVDMNLGSNNLVDLSPLSGLNVEKLNISNNPHLNVATLSGLKRLKMLLAEAVGLVSLTPFDGLKNLIHLDVASNQVEISSNCRLPSVETFTLAANGLTLLPDFGFSLSLHLKRLFLDNNKLSSISELSFAGLGALIELDLSANVITELHRSAFSELRSLKWLFLGGNRIQSLSSELFENNRNLYRLDLANNRIAEFDVPESVKSLNLADNRIERIDHKSFEKSRNLVKLDLVRNRLVSFDFDVLKACQHFRQLKLGANNLTNLLASKESLKSDRSIRVYLENNDLSDISNLTHFDMQELDVSNNSRLQLQPNSFAKFQNLEFLGLQGVNLDASLLKNGLLEGLTQLKTLIIASNDLQVIDLTTLPVSLEYLNANKANLREIVGFKDLLVILPRLEVVDIAGNKWSCEYWAMMKESFRNFGVYQPDICQVSNK